MLYSVALWGRNPQTDAKEDRVKNTIEIPRSPNYDKNYTGMSRYYGPCVVCGKDCKNPKYGVIEVNGGGEAALPDSPEADDVTHPGYMGEQPIGSDCLRAHPELLPYVVKW
jgi:hypothetical protein